MMYERNSPARCFMTPSPPSWKSRLSYSPTTMPLSERKKSPTLTNKADLFHVIHKVPAGDSPYVKAKHVQLVDKEPGRAISLFWAAINAGDRVESALKDMALVMKQLNRSDEAIEAIKSFRHLCPSDSQESLDNILVELYKRSGRVDEEITMLHHKLKQIEDGVTFVGRTTKQARSQGKKILITAEQEISRILGNLAWAYLQKGDYKTAEEHYRKALSFEVDRNKQCNLAICLMQMNKTTEAKFLLQAVSTASKNRKMDESFAKSFERASQMLADIESSSSDPSQTQQLSMNNSKESNGGSSNVSQHLSGNWDKESRESFGHNSLEDKNNTFTVRSMSQCSPQSWSVGELKEGKKSTESWNGKTSDIVRSRTENWSVTSEVEVSHARRRLYGSPDPARRDLKASYTKQKRCSWGFNNGYQRETRGDFRLDSKSSLGSPVSVDKYDMMHPKTAENSSTNGRWRASSLEDPAAVKYEDGKVMGSADSVHTLNAEAATKFTEKDDKSTLSEFATFVEQNQGGGGNCVSNSSAAKSFGNNKSSEDLIKHEFALGNKKPLEKKSWADIVEEEENEQQREDLFSGRYSCLVDSEDSAERFNSENQNSNIICQPSPWLSRNPTVRRSLCFHPELTPESPYSESPKNRRMLANERDSLSGENKLTRRNRLQVFQDITPHPETP